MALLTFLLAASTFIYIPPGVFFAFVIINGIAQAALGSYLQTSLIAVASLFGPAAVQSMMSGQAGVAIVVSIVQVLGALASTKDAVVATAQEPEEKSALAFFGLSTLFLVFSAAAQRWASNTPAYRPILRSMELQRDVIREPIDPDESMRLVSPGRDKGHIDKARIWRVARTNAVYEMAVAYVFVVTLVSSAGLFIALQPLT